MKTKAPIEVLKNLNVRECLGLANYLYPGMGWRYKSNTPDDEWDGHDVVTSSAVAARPIAPATLKIDYRSQVSTEQPRVIYQRADGSQEYPDEMKIIAYLSSIGKLRLA